MPSISNPTMEERIQKVKEVEAGGNFLKFQQEAHINIMPIISEVERLKADRDSLIKSGEFLCAEREKLRAELETEKAEHNKLAKQCCREIVSNKRLLEGLRNIEIDAQGGITYGGIEEILIRIVEKSTQLRTELIKTYSPTNKCEDKDNE